MDFPNNISPGQNLFKNRLLQHVLFWVVITTYLVIGFKSRFETFPEAFKHVVFYLPGHMFIVYSSLYFLIPRYILKRKFIWLLVFLVPVLGISALYIRFIDTTTYHLREAFDDPRVFLHAVFATLNICGIAIAIKLFKYWYLEQQAKQLAQQAGLTAQLELLKSQVHPHFLFNTLNNLYSLTLERSAEAPTVVLELSGLLRYMLYECNAGYVPLEKEIEIIDNYIKLEKIRYGDRLDISVNYSGDIKGKKIAPLLLLPFLENSFKHGASEQIEQCWISLDIGVTANMMMMKLSNSRLYAEIPEGGLGLENVKKRLDLLYNGNHTLKIIPGVESFTVSLTIELKS